MDASDECFGSRLLNACADWYKIGRQYWIFLSHIWAWFTGVAFVAAGLAISAKRRATAAGFWLGVMFLLFVNTLHGPAIARSPGSHDPDEWSNIFIVLGLASTAWICALAAGHPRQTGRQMGPMVTKEVVLN